MNNSDYIQLMAQCIELATKLVTCPEFKGERSRYIVISIAKEYFNEIINNPKA